VLVGGLPGFGNIGKIAANLLVEFTHAKVFAELYSPSFPDYVFVNKEGICRPPHYEFFAGSLGKAHFIILTGDARPSKDDVVAHYTLCDEVLDFAEKYGCRFIVVMGGVPQEQPSGEVFVAATSTKLAAETTEKGGIIYSESRIIGAAGLMLGLAKNRNWNGVCLLGATSGKKPDNEAAFSVFKFLLRMLNVETGLGEGFLREKH
jgi:hypothetical protein